MKRYLLLLNVVCLINLLSIGCTANKPSWENLTNDDYDFVQYASGEDILWASSFSSKKIDRIQLGNVQPELIKQQILLPVGASIVDLCNTTDVWILTENSVLRYLTDSDSWDESFLVDLDKPLACKVFHDKTIVLIGYRQGIATLVRYNNKHLTYIDLIDEWSDVTLDDQGGIWLLTRNRGIYMLSEDFAWLLQNTFSGRHIYYTGLDTFWILTEHQVYRWDKGNPKSVPVMIEGVTFSLGGQVYETSSGNVLIVAENGIWKVDGYYAEEVTLPIGVKILGSKSDFDEDSDILFATTGYGLFSLHIK